MIHSKSQKTKKIVPTDDEKLFYTRVKLKEEESNSQIKNKEIKDFFQTSPIKKPDLKKDPSYEYKIGNYLIQQTLGQGTFGKVKLGIYLPTQEKVAIKVLEKERLTDKDDKIRVKREFDMLSKFNHPNVILVTEIFESVDSYYSVMEYCEGGELFNYIVEKKRLSENETSFFYYQIINGLEYIHSLGIVHRDLKPENLLLTKEHLLKIIDFGLSNYFVEGQETLLSTPCGSPCYASPEMVSGKKYNGIKIDIWATGIILFAMLCGYLPFEDKDNEVLFDKILECKIDFPEFLSDESIDLIKKILVIDPEERIDIKGIKKHSFFLKGKQFFDQIFTIKQINVDDTENNSINNDNDNNIYNENSKDINIENDAIEKVDKAEVESIKDINENENKNEIEININKEKEKEKEDELSENKENINSNIKSNKDSTEKDIKNNDNNNLNYNKKEQIDIEENKDNINNAHNMSKINTEKELNKENLNDNSIKHKNSKDYRKSKDLNRHQHMDKKEKIDITNDSQNYNGHNNKKKLSDLIPKNYNKKLIQKTPENKNPKVSKQNKTTIDKTQKLETVVKERNTYGSIASIGSSLAENLNTMTNETNSTMNNMNYNANISFENTKRT
jgi:5'-AMP-activated protein kinase catalytic alpha subunit